ncbi:hypothetical protein SDRG_02204 [Saprolegnia diclina VS20]|uniref:Uncharacterized protein n=1 Tax=Saprolegnia diclina (strain VS20) TaxID=1156394 RepID=T0SBZ5_SAPDV|nr:hypothetical protein SDRG_02204 [Saprolegnia diclina VS20]EQC40302.1 hypothetical protein SDRG_02204 [Saprolegnia diclina VS20]|eukprot:XP_008606001.1 hypothetical protein SDRG_02204 [Saprolegnia diclina VS20]
MQNMSRTMVELALSVNAQHCCVSDRPAHLLPRIRVHGLDDDLTWPLPAAQLAALAAKFPGDAIVIPASSIQVVDPMPDASDVISGLHPWGTMTWHLAYIAIDTHGVADVWRPSSRRDRQTFGTIVHVLSCDATGGVVTVTHDDEPPTSWQPTSNHTIAFYEKCSVHIAPITSGARVTLVYQVSHAPCKLSESLGNRTHSDVRQTCHYSPIPTPTLTALQDAVAATRRHQWIAVGLHLRHSGPVSFGQLSRDAQAIVDFLIAANCVDVALLHADSAILHPACHVPASVIAACTRDRLLRFLQWPHDDLPAPDTITVVFWPKAHRVYFVGLEATTSLLTAYRNGDSSDLLGFATARVLTSAAIGLLRDSINDHYDLEVHPDAWTALSNHIVASGDVDLAMDFLWATDFNAFWCDADRVSDWFYALVTRCGLLQVLPRVLRHIDASDPYFDAAYMHLLARLVDDNCVRVRQRHATMGLQAGLEHLVARRGASKDALRRVDCFLRDALRVASCVAFEAADPIVGNVIAQRVPSCVVELIASFGDSCIVARSVAANAHLQHGLPRALCALRDANLVLPLQPYMDLALAAFLAPSRSYRYGIVPLLQLTAGSPMFGLLFVKAMAHPMPNHMWASLIAALDRDALSLSQRAQVLATIRAPFKSLPASAQIFDADDLYDVLRELQAAATVFARLDHAPGIVAVLAWVAALQAAYREPMTCLMEVLVPLHDTFLGAGRRDLASAIAHESLPLLYDRLASLSMPLPAKTEAENQRRMCACLACINLARFVATTSPTSFRTMGCNMQLASFRRDALATWRRYPVLPTDICIARVSPGPTLLLVNRADTIIAKMHVAAARLARTLAEETMLEPTVPSSPKRQRCDDERVT